MTTTVDLELLRRALTRDERIPGNALILAAAQAYLNEHTPSPPPPVAEDQRRRWTGTGKLFTVGPQRWGFFLIREDHDSQCFMSRVDIIETESVLLPEAATWDIRGEPGRMGDTPRLRILKGGTWTEIFFTTADRLDLLREVLRSEMEEKS